MSISGYTSGIGANEDVRRIFTSAGCQCLLELHEKHYFDKENIRTPFDAEYMLRYINFDKKHIPESMPVPRILLAESQLSKSI